AVAGALRREAETVHQRLGASSALERTVANMGESAAVIERLAALPPLERDVRSTDYVSQAMADAFDRALWLMKHDLAPGLFLDLGLLGWDTHIRNEPLQAELNGAFVRHFDTFLTALHRTNNQHGNLAANTLLVVGSEIGRFPRENDME